MPKASLSWQRLNCVIVTERLVTPKQMIFQPTGRDGLLFDLEQNIYFAINHTACLIWRFIEDNPGITTDHVIDHLFQHAGAPRDIIARDVAQLLTHWRARGMIEVLFDNGNDG